MRNTKSEQTGLAAPVLIGLLVLVLVGLGIFVYTNRVSTPVLNENTQNDPITSGNVVEPGTPNETDSSVVESPALQVSPEIESYNDTTLDQLDTQMETYDRDFDVSGLDSLNN